MKNPKSNQNINQTLIDIEIQLRKQTRKHALLLQNKTQITRYVDRYYNHTLANEKKFRKYIHLELMPEELIELLKDNVKIEKDEIIDEDEIMSKSEDVSNEESEEDNDYVKTYDENEDENGSGENEDYIEL